MDPTDPFNNPTTFGSRNAAFGAGRSGALHSVTGTAAASKSRPGFATGGMKRIGTVSPIGPTGGLTGVATSQRTQMWGTGRGRGTINGIGPTDQSRLATMPQM